MAISSSLVFYHWPQPGSYLRHSFHLGLYRVESVNREAGTMTVCEAAEWGEPPLPYAMPYTVRLSSAWRHAEPW